MKRGGARRRFVAREDCLVSIPTGRWGRKRVRVTRADAILKAEDLYTDLLRRDPASVVPGASGSVPWEAAGGRFGTDYEIRENAVWRFGRVFLRCAVCGRLATRIYWFRGGVSPACRRCWGLTYESRQERNYKGSRVGFLATLGMDRRGLSQWYTETSREARKELSLRRYAERRALLRTRERIQR